MSGNLADVAQTGWIASLEARLDALWAWVVTIVAFIWGVLVIAFESFVAWIYPIIIWMQGMWAWLVGIYYSFILPAILYLQAAYLTFVVPILTWLQGIVTWLQIAVSLIQGKLEDLINIVYNKVFKDVEGLRTNIVEVLATIKDVASVFSRDLADKIQVTEDKFLKLLNSYTRDLRDFAISQIHDYTAPIISKINELDLIIGPITKAFKDRFGSISKIIEATFEKPQVLKRDVLFTTSQAWGVDLWNDLFAGVTPKGPIIPGIIRETLQVDPVVDKYIETIFAEQAGDWKDVSSRIDEEIREHYYGEVIPIKTKITVPKLPKSWEIPREQLRTYYPGFPGA